MPLTFKSTSRSIPLGGGFFRRPFLWNQKRSSRKEMTFFSTHYSLHVFDNRVAEFGTFNFSGVVHQAGKI